MTVPAEPPEPAAPLVVLAPSLPPSVEAPVCTLAQLGQGAPPGGGAPPSQ